MLVGSPLIGFFSWVHCCVKGPDRRTMINYIMHIKPVPVVWGTVWVSPTGVMCVIESLINISTHNTTTVRKKLYQFDIYNSPFMSSIYPRVGKSLRIESFIPSTSIRLFTVLKVSGMGAYCPASMTNAFAQFIAVLSFCWRTTNLSTRWNHTGFDITLSSTAFRSNRKYPGWSHTDG